MTTTARPRHSSEADFALLNEQENFLVGLDEVGRGPLAGPVVACGVCLDCHERKAFEQLLANLGVTDSKKLTSKKRKKILQTLGIGPLKSGSPYPITPFLRFCLFSVDHQTIDRINILQASLLAMGQCYKSFNLKGPALILVDGHFPISLSHPLHRQIPLVQGDSRSDPIALASIIAKEYRDAQMKALAEEHPGYGLDSHFGYPTPFHRQAIQGLGPSPIHRRSFKGVKEYTQK